jgi:SAM-dependent methyltransferase
MPLTMDPRHRHAAAAPAWACPTAFDGERLQQQVIAMYERVALLPAGAAFHFHLGADYAVRRLGYDATALARIPAASTSRFAGVGHPFAAGPVPAGAVVLDHACGAGTDLLLAAGQAGPAGCAIGVDITPSMRRVASQSAASAGLADRVRILAGRFEDLPLPDASVDLVLSNGVLNLATDKLQVLREVMRVLRAGGALYLSDVVLERPLSPLARDNPALWAACVGGALTEAALHELIAHAGFAPPRLAARHDCFAGTTLQHKFGRELRPSSITLAAHKRG